MCYKYECQERACRATFCIQQSIKDEPLTECLSCGGKMRRVITGGLGFILKGKGYYSTDNRKEKK